MVDFKIIAGAVGIIAVMAVLSGAFDGEVHRAVMPPAQIQHQANVPDTWTQAPTAMSQGLPAGAPPPPSFVSVAGAPNAGMGGGDANAAMGGDVANYLPSNIQISEAHWQGMDVMVLSAELRQKLLYPRGLQGLLVDEVTLNAARSGLKAGDVIVNVGNIAVTTLEEFQRGSRMVRNLEKVELTALRKAEKGEDGRYAVRRVSIIMRGDPDLGFAQLEAAPMILPGDGRPHPYRGACTNCHSIGTGFELPDPDLITLPPPPISHATVVQGVSPHRDRGPCEACHRIIQNM